MDSRIQPGGDTFSIIPVDSSSSPWCMSDCHYHCLFSNTQDDDPETNHSSLDSSTIYRFSRDGKFISGSLEKGKTQFGGRKMQAITWLSPRFRCNDLVPEWQSMPAPHIYERILTIPNPISFKGLWRMNSIINYINVQEHAMTYKTDSGKYRFYYPFSL